jgi:hypothetical protein
LENPAYPLNEFFNMPVALQGKDFDIKKISALVVLTLLGLNAGFIGCRQEALVDPKIKVLVWADAPQVQQIATPGKINLSLTNQDKKAIPRVVLRSEKLEDFVINSVKPKPLESGEGSWTFGKVKSRESLNVALDVTPTNPGLHTLKFAFESSGWQLTRPDGSPATFEVQISVGKVVDWED